jgi:uncharacterized protein (TIGR00369 family)
LKSSERGAAVERAMDSLEHARAIFAQAPFVVDLGIEPTAVAQGRVETRLALQPRHLQHTGQVHAGVVTTLADHTAGAAAQSVLPVGSFAITAELKISLLRATRGRALVCKGHVVKAGRALVFAEAEVFAEDACGAAVTLVAKLSATMAVVQAGGGKTVA